MDSEVQQQGDNDGVIVPSITRKTKGPDDFVIVQMFCKTRDAMKTLKKYRRETNAEVLERVVSEAIIAKNADIINQ